MDSTAPARAALAGNPSDGYGGAVLAVTIAEQRARAVVRSAPRLVSSPPCELVDATVRRFARVFEPAAIRTAVEWDTSIPQGVGLGGSSAIVIATLRALCLAHGVALDRPAVARFALAVEVEDLGIAAGLQDRVAQAYGGLTFMDFAARPGRTGRAELRRPGGVCSLRRWQLRGAPGVDGTRPAARRDDLDRAELCGERQLHRLRWGSRRGVPR